MTKSELVLAISEKRKDLSKKDIESVVNTIFNSMRNSLIRGERIEIVDPDRETFPGSKVRSPDHAARLLVISDDHYKWGWQPILNGWRQAGLITPLREIGRCGETSRCLEIYRIENKSTVGTTGTSQLH